MFLMSRSEGFNLDSQHPTVSEVDSTLLFSMTAT